MISKVLSEGLAKSFLLSPADLFMTGLSIVLWESQSW